MECMKRSMAMILTGTTILVMTVTATVTGCQSDTSKEKEETLYGEVSKNPRSRKREKRPKMKTCRPPSRKQTAEPGKRMSQKKQCPKEKYRKEASHREA